MRGVFNKTLIKIAEKDPRIHMVLADIGYGEIEGFARKFPERYYNCGVMEQHMTGVACGVATDCGQRICDGCDRGAGDGARDLPQAWW